MDVPSDHAMFAPSRTMRFGIRSSSSPDPGVPPRAEAWRMSSQEKICARSVAHGAGYRPCGVTRSSARCARRLFGCARHGIARGGHFSFSRRGGIEARSARARGVLPRPALSRAAVERGAGAAARVAIAAVSRRACGARAHWALSAPP
eukprot:31408-Pelagococcus_subviridis.AAC.6